MLHNFNNDGTDGTEPLAGLIFDAAGNLYGTTYEGGAYNATGRCSSCRRRGRNLDGEGAV